MDAAKQAQASIIAGVGVGAFVYLRQAKPPPCNGIDSQMLLQAIDGAETHPFEDFVLGMLGLADSQVQGATLGAVDPNWAASFYSWYHGLSDTQKAALKQAAASDEACAALQTAQQAASGASALVSAAVAGLIAWAATPFVLEAFA